MAATSRPCCTRRRTSAACRRSSPHPAGASSGASCRGSANAWTRAASGFLSLWREVGDALGASLARRFERSTRACGAGRGTVARSIDGRTDAGGDVVAAYTRANAELLGIGDGALVAYASADNRPSALACVVLLYAKEKTGIERARIGAGFAAHSISDDDRRALAALTSARTQLPARVCGDGAAAGRAAARTGAGVGQLRGADAHGRAVARPAARPSSTSTRAAGSTLMTREMDHLGEIGTAPSASSATLVRRRRRRASPVGVLRDPRVPKASLVRSSEVKRDVDLHHVVRRVGERLVEAARVGDAGAQPHPLPTWKCARGPIATLIVSLRRRGSPILVPIISCVGVVSQRW